MISHKENLNYWKKKKKIMVHHFDKLDYKMPV